MSFNTIRENKIIANISEFTGFDNSTVYKIHKSQNASKIIPKVNQLFYEIKGN